jgi:ankyrin repeat protein
MELVFKMLIRIYKLLSFIQQGILFLSREGKNEVSQLLIDNKANVNHLDKFGQTCIFYAIKEGHLNTVKLLIDNGADINVVDSKNETPLSHAFQMKKDSIVQYLESKGAANSTKTRKTMNKSKSQSLLDISNTESVADQKKTDKYIFMTIDKLGNEVPMSNEDLMKFLNSNPRIKALLLDQLPK